MMLKPWPRIGIQLYGYFRIEGDNNPHPPKAMQWRSVREMKRRWGEFYDEAKSNGQRPMLFAYIGVATGDEETNGYPDYPDYTNRAKDVVIT